MEKISYVKKYVTVINKEIHISLTFSCMCRQILHEYLLSSSTSHKKTPSLRLFLREFKKILPNTFIYESFDKKKKKN